MSKNSNATKNQHPDIWSVDETEHSEKFFKNLGKLSECFQFILEDLNEEGYVYDVDKIVEIYEITSSTVDLQGSGFLPSSFFQHSAKIITDGNKQVDIWKKIKERDDAYFSNILGSFFTVEARKEFLDSYLTLFDQRDGNGELILGTDDRETLWMWIDELVKCTILHEHEIRQPIVIKNSGVVTYHLYPGTGLRIPEYAKMWNISLLSQKR